MSLLDWIIIGLGVIAVVIYTIVKVKNFKHPKAKTKKEEVKDIVEDVIEND